MWHSPGRAEPDFAANVENVENAFFVLVEPHDPHGWVRRAARGSRKLVTCPQSSHLYSKIGIAILRGPRLHRPAPPNGSIVAEGRPRLQCRIRRTPRGARQNRRAGTAPAPLAVPVSRGDTRKSAFWLSGLDGGRGPTCGSANPMPSCDCQTNPGLTLCMTWGSAKLPLRAGGQNHCRMLRFHRLTISKRTYATGQSRGARQPTLLLAIFNPLPRLSDTQDGSGTSADAARRRQQTGRTMIRTLRQGRFRLTPTGVLRGADRLPCIGGRGGAGRPPA